MSVFFQYLDHLVQYFENSDEALCDCDRGLNVLGCNGMCHFYQSVNLSVLQIKVCHACHGDKLIFGCGL
jgi:hypothetical protein